ncbi:hypothetical protein D9V32_08495 [Mycetocola tolaasinivorans]|uniref:Thioredoxin family protein n=1 Tax=Mycetocola tolaasinivorans TaxID=76635 RepID=A0A3L7A815_9MICO|nr:hypothetical protein [Mycetocola tolaasinivorans]RLP75512.1 hypothetical protein D9V32_08495 [Mycetocola tolaasinivorans]
MSVQILAIDGCPSLDAATENTRLALEALGLAETAIEHVIIRDAEGARAHSFAGSPTILVSGTDLFPSDGATESLACRVYPTETGIAPAPSRTQLVTALRERLTPPIS